MADKKILCVSVDLDSMACYYGIHGITPPDNIKTIHFTKGLTRFLELFDEMNIKATLFTIGEELEDPSCSRILKDSTGMGHEPANHTWSHPYNLTRLTLPRIKHEIRRAHEAIEKAAGRGPVGFRAPGYHLTNRVRDILVEMGYRYDASLLPSPPYYLAKSTIIILSGLRGRKSHSIIGGPGMILSPGCPFRSGRHYWRRGRGLLEIPCSVVTPLNIPFIGTTITMFPRKATSMLLRFLRSAELVSIEFHAIDMMDARLDDFETLIPFQPDAKISLAEKEAKIRGVLSRLTGEFDFEPMTLEGAAGVLHPGANTR